jgi:hypothetical protein
VVTSAIDQPDIVPEIADLLLRMEGKTWSLCTGVDGDRLYLSIRTTNPRAEAGNLMRRLIGKAGRGGGHGTMAGGYVMLDKRHQRLAARTAAAKRSSAPWPEPAPALRATWRSNPGDLDAATAAAVRPRDRAARVKQTRGVARNDAGLEGEAGHPAGARARSSQTGPAPAGEARKRAESLSPGAGGVPTPEPPRERRSPPRSRRQIR